MFLLLFSSETLTLSAYLSREQTQDKCSLHIKVLHLMASTSDRVTDPQFTGTCVRLVPCVNIMDSFFGKDVQFDR